MGAAGITSVCAVVVTYQPDAGSFSDLIERVRPQVAEMVVVDNGGKGRGESGAVEADLTVLPQVTNVGLAAAQNVGIAYARSHGHTHVLLLDQDSLPGIGMVAELLAVVAGLQTAGVRVGAVGPRFRDDREDHDAPFVRVRFPVSQKVWCTGEPQVQCDFLIASGALIPLAVLDEVGDMAAGMFIDNVDLEWSFRARSQGYALFGACSATMSHRLGDARRPVLFGRRQVTTHSPVRLYYIMRNRVVLSRLPHTPTVWSAQDLLRIPVKFVLFALLIGPRLQNARFMVRGLVDGFRGRQGACPLPTTR